MGGGGTRLLAVSDLHLRRSRLDWVVEHADAFDLVLIVGDLLDAAFGDAHDQLDTAFEFLAEVSRHSRVAVSSGNHDLDRRRGQERIAGWHHDLDALGIARDGDLVLVDDTTATHAISVCPWWDGPAGRARLTEHLARHGRVRPDGRWIWMHHAPAAGSATAWNGRRDHGDELLGGLVEHYRPDVVLSGHVHEAPFVAGGSWWDRYAGTLLCNAGDAAGSIAPPHVVVDLAADRVEWHAAGYATEGCSIDPRRASPSVA